MSRSVVFITGASRGLGKAIALQCLEKNYTVYAGVRNLNQAPKDTIPIYIDLLDEDSIAKAVTQTIKKSKKIDILINNAGKAFYDGADCMKLEEARSLFEVNFFGSFRLTQLVIPFMRKQMSGNITFISSIRVTNPCPFLGMYIASKSAIEAVAYEWHQTLKKWNISVTVAQPPPLENEMQMDKGTYYNSRNNPYFPFDNIKLNRQPTKETAQIIMKYINSTSPPFVFQTK